MIEVSLHTCYRPHIQFIGYVYLESGIREYCVDSVTIILKTSITNICQYNFFRNFYANPSFTFISSYFSLFLGKNIIYLYIIYNHYIIIYNLRMNMFTVNKYSLLNASLNSQLTYMLHCFLSCRDSSVGRALD